ncbi:MAG: PadR family transcriptional regulator [Tepidiformaceae bacterium]
MSLRFAILGLLANDELSGYELTRRFERSVGYFWRARSQQIYPELARLEDEGLIHGRTVEQVRRPHKRLFQLSADGREQLLAWATTPSPLTLVKDEFMVKVWCYGMLDPVEAEGAITQQRRQHEERLASYRVIEAAFEGTEPAAIADDYLGAYLTLQGGIAMEESFIAWCERVQTVLQQRLPARTP